jgi:hypothetical protein
MIKISTRRTADKVVLILEDSAFHLSLEDRMALGSFKNDAFPELGYQAVMGLIQDMGVEIALTMKEPKGNVITLTFSHQVASAKSAEGLDNVIYLKP